MEVKDFTELKGERNLTSYTSGGAYLKASIEDDGAKYYLKLSNYDDEQEALDWVRDRIVPPNRQNINQLLQEANLDEYDEYGLIRKTGGISSNDYLYIVAKN